GRPSRRWAAAATRGAFGFSSIKRRFRSRGTMKSLLRGRLRRASSGNRSHHHWHHVEAVEPRVLLSVDVSYDGATTTRFSWDAAAGARPILEAPPAQPSLFDQQFVAPIGSRMFLRIAGIEGEATDTQHPG